MVITNQLVHLVTRIRSVTVDGQESTGTGFFHRVNRTNDTYVPILVTNKHVVEGSAHSVIRLSLKDDEAVRFGSRHVEVNIPTKGSWHFHPNPEVDLCYCPIGFFLNRLPVPIDSLLWTTTSQLNLPTPEDLEAISAVEDVIMIGYPIGLWDEFNNRPIFRRGVTATHANVSYNGNNEFLVDIAAFPGSSGSPVFLYRDGIRINNTLGEQVSGRKGIFFLAGILYAGPMYSAQGEIRVKPVPTRNEILAYAQIPTNLGLVISSSALLDFEQVQEST